VDYGHIDHAMGGRRTAGPLAALPARVAMGEKLPLRADIHLNHMI
jgi:hypothetical protein